MVVAEGAVVVSAVGDERAGEGLGDMQELVDQNPLLIVRL